MRLFSTGRYLLHSGTISGWTIDCRAFSSYDWEALAMVAHNQFMQSFFKTVGIPSGGMKFAMAMDKYSLNPAPAGTPYLICDDVCSTGKSFEEKREELHKLDPGCNVRGIVVFARGPVPDWVDSIWTLGKRS